MIPKMGRDSQGSTCIYAICRHRRKIYSFSFYFPRYRPPFGECVCDLYLFFVSRYELCVCGNLCTCVRVSTNLESPPTMGNFKV
jgi:hypothetical protein